MSIPQVCPSCGNNYSEGHFIDCSVCTPSLQWSAAPLTSIIGASELFEKHGYAPAPQPVYYPNEGAIKRIMEYLTDEIEESTPTSPSGNLAAITLLKTRAEELRKEAATISLVDSRAKRNFAAGILEQIAEELASC